MTVVNGWCWDDISSLWSTCANSDKRFTATVHWHSLSQSPDPGRAEQLLSSSPHKRSFLSYIVIWTAAISGPWSVKLMILIILDPGVCQNQRPGLTEGTISEGVTTAALCGHYQLWTQRTWRKSPPTLCSSLKPASAVFKGANVSPSLILNRHFYISLDQIFLDQAWADGYRVITMQYLPLLRPSRWSHMECWRWGANPMGESFNYFLLNYHFYA